MIYWRYMKIYIHWTGPNFLRGPDRIALSSHTGSISPTAKASRGRQRRAGRLRSLHCVPWIPCLFFSDYSPKPETGGHEPCCTSGDWSPSGYLLLCFIVCSFVWVRLGSTYTIRVPCYRCWLAAFPAAVPPLFFPLSPFHGVFPPGWPKTAADV